VPIWLFQMRTILDAGVLNPAECGAGSVIATCLDMHCNVFQPGMIELRFDSKHDLSAEAQEPGLQALATQQLPRGMILDARQVKLTSTVLNFWLERLDALGDSFRTVGIVSENPLEAVLAGAFGLAASLRRHPVRIELFSAPEAARSWASPAGVEARV
jgi:hypothetical protein